MDRNQKLEQITNGINAAYKIKNVRDSLTQNDSNDRQEINNVDFLMQMLSVIAEYSPEPHNNTISKKLEKSAVYHNTYKNLKQHIKDIQTNRQVDTEGLAKTLEIVRPILDGDKRSFVDKMLQIQKILKS